MALVGAWVHRDAFSTLINAELRMLNNIRVVAFSGISNQRNFIEINTQCSHGSIAYLIGMGLSKDSVSGLFSSGSAVHASGLSSRALRIRIASTGTSR